jgi:two-component system, OmpR family, response regulator
MASVESVPVGAAGVEGRHRPTLVIAEDHAEMADVLLTYLEAAGYEVHLARDGIAAASLIERVAPMLVVLDANMPGLSGWTILERLKGPGATSPTPQVVMLTGDDNFPPVAALADVVLRKPAALRKIAAVLAERLRPEPPPPIAA